MVTTVVSMLTCLNAEGTDRATLHDVFRSLSFVPETFFAFIEFDYEDTFSFEVWLLTDDGRLVETTETHLVLKSASGRTFGVLELPLRMANVLPGGYNVEVFEVDAELVLHSRNVFFGEM